MAKRPNRNVCGVLDGRDVCVLYFIRTRVNPMMIIACNGIRRQRVVRLLTTLIYSQSKTTSFGSLKSTCFPRLSYYCIVCCGRTFRSASIRRRRRRQSISRARATEQRNVVCDRTRQGETCRVPPFQYHSFCQGYKSHGDPQGIQHVL